MVLLMSGLTRKNQAGVSGLVGPLVHYTQFTTSTDGAGAWVKPDGVKVVWVEVVGAGGGGGGSNASGGESSGGGGGGAYAWACFSAAALPATLDVVVGAGGTGAESNAQNNGAAGGSSNINMPSGATEATKIILQAFGGGGGVDHGP